MFWRDSMISELPQQSVPIFSTHTVRNLKAASDTMQEDSPSSQASHTVRPSHLLILPIPCLPASADFPKQLLNELVKPCLDNEAGQAILPVTSSVQGSPISRQTTQHALSYHIDGLSLLLKSAAVSRYLLSIFETLLTFCNSTKAALLRLQLGCLDRSSTSWLSPCRSVYSAYL